MGLLVDFVRQHHLHSAHEHACDCFDCKFAINISFPEKQLIVHQMNYASAFLALVLLSALLYWYISGRKFYHGPLIEAQVEDSQSDNGVLAHEKSDEKRDVMV